MAGVTYLYSQEIKLYHRMNYCRLPPLTNLTWEAFSALLYWHSHRFHYLYMQLDTTIPSRNVAYIVCHSEEGR